MRIFTADNPGSWWRAAGWGPGAIVAVSSADGGVGRSTVVAALGGTRKLAGSVFDG